MPPNQTQIYETPDGVAIETDKATVYLNVNRSRHGEGLVCWRLNKRLKQLGPDGKERRFLVTFDLDAEMTRVMAEKALAVAAAAIGRP